MIIFSPDNIHIDKELLLKIMECKEGTNAFKIINSIYESTLEKAYSLIKPIGFINTGKIPGFIVLREKENFNNGIFCAVTLGADISRESSSLFSAGKYMEGLLLDTMADHLLINLTNALYKEKILPYVKKKGVGVSYRHSPGCQGVPIKYQKHILDLAGKEAKKEISITEGMMLSPVKSTAYFYMTDKSLPLRLYDWDCRRCDVKDCSYRFFSCVEAVIIANDKENKTTFLKEMNLLEGLREQSWMLESYCNGAGYCGKCKVLLSGNVPAPLPVEKEKLTHEELQKGTRLACRTKPLEGMIIHLPDKIETNFQIEQGFRYKKDYSKPGKELRSDSFVNKKRRGEQSPLAIAIDLGTTTVVILIVDPDLGKTIGVSTFLNPQKKFGADVISRIQYASGYDKNILTSLIRESLTKATNELIREKDINAERIKRINIAGNTTMIHLLMGFDVKSLAVSPFKPVTIDPVRVPASQIFDKSLSVAEVYIFPAVSAYVGPDIVSGMYNRSFENLKETTLFLDLGTNGEIVLGDSKKILCASAAAGPAFEGARISCGTGCVRGAVSFAGIDKGKVWYSTIGQVPPVGLCGSGLIDLVAALLDEGIIDNSGTMSSGYKKKGLFIAEDPEGNEMRLMQKDIRELQLAKSAIRAGTEILIREFNIKYDDIDKVYLSGGFGSHINADSALRIGLLPKTLKNKIVLAGNSSLGGAVDLLLDQENEDGVMEIIKKVHYIELSTNPDFNSKFAEYMLF